MSKLKSWGHLRVADEVRFVGSGRRGGGQITSMSSKRVVGLGEHEQVWVVVQGDGWTVEVRPTDIELRSLLDRLAREVG